MAAFTAYSSFKLSQIAGPAVDFDSDTIRVALVSSAYTPNLGTHALFSDVSTAEVSGTNYTSGGSALTSKTVTVANGVVTFDADDVVFAADPAGFTNARYAILYKDGASRQLIGVLDMAQNYGNAAGEFKLRFPVDGIFKFQ